MEFKPPGEKIYEYSRRVGDAKGKGKASVFEDGMQDGEDHSATTYEVYHVCHGAVIHSHTAIRLTVQFSKSTWETPGFREYHRRMQLFILLYIEAGSYIQEDEDVWEFVVLYEKRRRRDAARTPTYHFIGYSTLFPFYCFPDRVRLRIR